MTKTTMIVKQEGKKVVYQTVVTQTKPKRKQEEANDGSKE